MTSLRLALTGGLAAAAFLVPGAARADDLILCTGSIDGGGETCVYDSDVPVLNKYDECWPLLYDTSSIGRCRHQITGR